MLSVAIIIALGAVGFMITVPFSGDEEFYAARADAIADLLTGRGGTLRGVTEDVVHNGWFMPGIAFVLTPLYAVVPDAGIPATRLYLIAVHTLLWAWTVREITAAFGRNGRIAFLAFPTLGVMWLVFATTGWGDLPAGLCVAIVGSRIYRTGVEMLEHERISLRHLLVTELAMIAMVYLRGNTIVLVVAVHVLLVGIAIISGHWSLLLRRLGVVATGVALFAALLAPWSLTASRLLGDEVVTTSSAALSIAVTFGDDDKICFGPCPVGGGWSGKIKFSEQYARRHGISHLEAQSRMAHHVLRTITWREYAVQARDNFNAYITPTGPGPRRGRPFMDRFIVLSTLDVPPTVRGFINGTVRFLTLVVYVPFFAALVLANVGVFIRSRRRQLLSLLVKALTISLFLQPFVHLSHARYWPAFAPTMTIAAILIVAWYAARSRHDLRFEGLANDDGTEQRLDLRGRTLVCLQIGYVVVIATVALLLTFA